MSKEESRNDWGGGGAVVSMSPLDRAWCVGGEGMSAGAQLVGTFTQWRLGHNIDDFYIKFRVNQLSCNLQ